MPRYIHVIKHQWIKIQGQQLAFALNLTALIHLYHKWIENINIRVIFVIVHTIGRVGLDDPSIHTLPKAL